MRRTWRYAISETGDPDEAKDITQDTFVRAWTSLNGFRGESSLLHWLFRITRNLVIDRARARKRRPTVSLDAPRNRDSDETLGDRQRFLGLAGREEDRAHEERPVHGRVAGHADRSG